MPSETVQAVVVLFVILNAEFYSSPWGNRTLMMSARDAASVLPRAANGDEPPPRLLRSWDPGAPAWQFEPAMACLHQQFWVQHQLPLWNPYVGYGAPWAAGMVSQPFFPPSFRTVSWFLVLRLLTAGVLAYLYMRYFVSHAAALAGSIACMLTGYLCFDRAAHATKPAEPFRPVYDGEAKVYEYSGSLPRASVFYSVVPVDSALARDQDPALDVWRQVVVSTNGADLGTRRSLEALSHAARQTAKAASIVSYDSQRVTMRAILERPGIVMLTDSDYPGWNACLDGHRVPVLVANFLFRGVPAPAGTHQIEFRYEPKSYLYGGLISLMAFSAGLAWFTAARRRERTLASARRRVRNAELEADAVH